MPKDKVIKVRVTKKAYYNDRLLQEGAVVDYAQAEGTELPKWADPIEKAAKVEEKVEEAPKETTIHEMAQNSKPVVAKPAKPKVSVAKPKSKE